MESLMELRPLTECVSPTAPIWQDVLAQAVTGELVAAMNYAALAEICDDPEEAAEAREHAAIERAHAAALRQRAGRSEWTSSAMSTENIGSGSARLSCAASRSATSSAA